jgi:hypothetical protein
MIVISSDKDIAFIYQIINNINLTDIIQCINFAASFTNRFLNHIFITTNNNQFIYLKNKNYGKSTGILPDAPYRRHGSRF